ncbi:MAG: hypothetical protein AAB792_00325, partial [Patescibacteria group bacterium]
NANRISFLTTGATGLIDLTGYASVSQGFEAGGRIIGSGLLQIGSSDSTVGYSRFGTAGSGHGLSSSQDVMISGKLEVDGSSYFDGTVNFTGIASSAYFYAQPGTAASPSFSFSIDQDTGIFRKALNSLSLSAGGIERLNLTSTTASISNSLYVSSNGNVGIGTTSPATKLDVIGNASVSQNFEVGNDLFVTGEGVFSGTSSNSFAGSLDITKGLNVANGTLRVTTNGNVGIGTTGPAAKLDVWGTSGANDIFNLASSSGTSVLRVTKSGSVGIGTAGPTTKLDVIGNASVSQNFEVGNDLFVTGEGVFSGTSSNSFAGSLDITKGLNVANGTLRVTTNGNVGIGTTGPSQKLDIVGGNAKIANGQQLIFGDLADANGFTLGVAASTNDALINQANIALLTIQTAGTGHIALMPGGNVGIGTTGPSAKLDVVSDVILREGLQVGYTATASYSRFGSANTSYS